MVSTGARAQVLGVLLEAAGFSISATPPPPRVDLLPADVRVAVVALYRELGGQLERPSLRPGAWDLALAGGVVVELDEELHFNRYRARTLAAPWARSLPWVDAYLAMCTRHEDECVSTGSWGKRWSNGSCERMFGHAAPAAELDAPGGAPRWKQRALYDAVKDVAGFLPGVPRLVRLAVHDEISGVSLDAVLKRRSEVAPRDLRALVEARMV